MRRRIFALLAVIALAVVGTVAAAEASGSGGTMTAPTLAGSLYLPS